MTFAAQGQINPALASNASRRFQRCVIGEGSRRALVHQPFELGDALLQRVVLRRRAVSSASFSAFSSLTAWMVSSGSLL